MLNALPRLALGLLLMMLTQGAASAAHHQQPAPPALANASFERGVLQAAPPGWVFVTQCGAACQVVGGGAGQGARAALIDATAASRRGRSKLMQSVDARQLRGKRVRYSAAVRTDGMSASDSVQLFCRVDRPRDANGKAQLGAFDDMKDRPIRAVDWQRFEIVLEVASDATEVVLGLTALGGGRVWIDDAKLAVVSAGAGGASRSPEVAAPRSEQPASTQPKPQPKSQPPTAQAPAPKPAPRAASVDQDPPPSTPLTTPPRVDAPKQDPVAPTAPVTRAPGGQSSFWTWWLCLPGCAIALFFLGLWPLRSLPQGATGSEPFDVLAAYRDDQGMGWLRFFALRFTVIYWALACLPRLLMDILWWLGAALDRGAHEAGIRFLDGWSEPLSWLGGRIASGAAACEAWLGELSGGWMLGVTTIAAPSGEGSDTLLGYLTAFNFVVLAAVLGAGWTFFKRRYPSRNASVDLVRSLLRYALAFALLTWAYGILTSATSAGSFLESRLEASVGKQAPDELMWGLMETSRPYMVFLGVGELVAAFLLLWRRTMLLGAVLAVVWMTNALLLSCCFDMPYKLKASQHLMMALAVLVPDARRVGGLLMWNRNPADQGTASVWGVTRAGWLRWVPKVIIVAACFLVPIGHLAWRIATSEVPRAAASARPDQEDPDRVLVERGFRWLIEDARGR
jgi:hypothetical protein